MNNIGHVIFNYNDTRIINLYTKCAEYYSNLNYYLYLIQGYQIGNTNLQRNNDIKITYCDHNS